MSRKFVWLWLFLWIAKESVAGPVLDVIGFPKLGYPSRAGSGYCLNFNGVNNYVSVGPVPMATPAVTVEAWVKFDDFANGDIISKYNNNSLTRSDDEYELAVKGGQLYFEVTDGGAGVGQSSISTSELKLGVWYHLAGVYNGSKVVLLVNGVAQPSGVLAGPLNSAVIVMTIGAGKDNGTISDFFHGSIDEVRIWKNVIAISELRGFMCSKNLKSHPNYDDLVNYFRFDDGTGVQLGDLKNVKDGQLNGGMGDPSWSYSGAAIGDTSVYNYASAMSFSLNTGAFGVVEALNVSGVIDSLHLYYVQDTINTTVAPAGFDSLSLPGYFGVFQSGFSSSVFDVQLNYTTNTKLNGYVGEDSIKMVGRDNNANLSVGLPTGLVTQSTDIIANKIRVANISSSFEAIPAYGKFTCDTSSSFSLYTWKGSVDNNWFNCANWDTGTMPGKSARVFVPGITSVPSTRQPVIKGKKAFCKSIELNTDDKALLTVDVTSGGGLEISD